jgi:hypothetical protein
MQPDAAATALGGELFVYYRIDPARADALQSAAVAMQDALRAQHPGLAARLLRRPGLREGLQTWMEVYTLPAGVDAARLAIAIERDARVLAPLLIGERHVEHFVACAS